MAEGLAALEERVRRDLRHLAYPEKEWVAARPAPGGGSFTDVLIVGGGQGGQTIAFGLARDRVTNVRVIDANPAGREGPWRTFARMETLRSPKFLTGPDLGVPSLTFQAWFEAQFGEAGWDRLGKIPKEQWADYLAWVRRMTGVTVENGVRLVGIEPVAGGFAARLERDGTSETVHARKIVLATGIEGSGAWYVPPGLVEHLPADRWAHGCDPIDFDRLRGRRIAVLGVAASGFDNAATALEHGAAEVHLFSRRPDIQTVQPYKHLMWMGFLKHFADLDDAWRWRFMNHLLGIREALPTETWQRTIRHPNLRIHTGSPWIATGMAGGAVAVTTPKATHTFDFLIFGTGLAVDLARRPELAGIAPLVATWADRYAPPKGEENDWIADYPYLDPGFALTEKVPGSAPWLADIHVFTFGATVSLGLSGSSINGMKFAAPRLVAAITRDLFRADAPAHFEGLLAYRVPEFDVAAAPPAILAAD
ncbi:MAG: FAD/NAD(P)-binding protein [Alphaproteobacteria bacterium]